MKNIFLFIITFFLISNLSFSQGTLRMTIEVVDSKQIPKSNLPITLVETSTFQHKSFVTDASGKLTFELNEGKNWMLNIGDMKGYQILHVPENGGFGQSSASVTYNVAHWNRINQPAVDRDKISLEIIPQKSISSSSYPQRGFSIIEIELKSPKGQVWRGVTVKLVSLELLKAYVAKTNSQGIARLYVPNNQHYQIDMDGEVDYSYCDVGNQSMVKSMRLLYEKINFIEKENNDGFIEQTFTEALKPVSNRVMVTLFISGGPNDGANEDVYLDMIRSNNKYHGVTDENGKIVFLLPKKREYIVEFKFQENAGIVDLSRFRGIGQLQDAISYIPDPRLEHPEQFLPTKTDVKMFDLNEFNNSVYTDNLDDNIINVHAKWGSNVINSGSKEALLELGFSVKSPKQKQKISKPLNISFVLDRSGSMIGENIEILKKSMLEFINKLRPIDNVSLIFFNDESVLAYPQSKVNKNELTDIIYALEASGGTNIYEGLKMGYEEVSKTFNPKHTNRVILLTDGYGSKPIDFILEQSKKYFQKGISVSTIGVGLNYNNSLLTLISEYSGGLEHHVVDASGISSALDQEFESLFYPLASDLKITVKYNNKIIYKTIYGIPEQSNSNNTVKFEIGKVYSTMNTMALLKFKINEPNKKIENDIITINVEYYDEQKAQEISIKKEMNLTWTEETDIEQIRDANIKQLYTVATINQCLKAIADLCDEKNYKKAKETVQETLASISKTNQNKYSTELQPLIKMLETYLETLELAIKKLK